MISKYLWPKWREYIKTYKTFINLLSQTGFKRYLTNTSWLAATQGVRFVLSFFIGLWIARFLGPEDYGIYNYVLSFISILLTLSICGTTETLIKELIEHKNKVDILNAAFVIRFLCGMLTIFFTIIFLSFSSIPQNIRYYIIIILPMLIIQSFDVIDSFYLATVNFRHSAKYRIIQIIISNILKVYLIHNKMPLPWFIFVNLLDMLIYSIFIYKYYRQKEPSFIFIPKSLLYIKKIALTSFPILIINFTHTIFLKIDQIMLGSLASQSSIGLYASSVKIIEILGFFATIVIQSLFPAIINAKNMNNELYLQRFTFISKLLIFSGIILSIATFIFSRNILLLLYGEEYKEGYRILQILSFNIIFSGMASLSLRWYITENLKKLLIIKFFALAMFNIILNLFFIPQYGIEGTAYASLISNFVFLFLFDSFFKETRICFWIIFPFEKILFKHKSPNFI